MGQNLTTSQEQSSSSSDKLRELKKCDDGLITEDQFNSKRDQIINDV